MGTMCEPITDLWGIKPLWSTITRRAQCYKDTYFLYSDMSIPIVNCSQKQLLCIFNDAIDVDTHRKSTMLTSILLPNSLLLCKMMSISLIQYEKELTYANSYYCTKYTLETNMWYSGLLSEMLQNIFWLKVLQEGWVWPAKEDHTG